MRHRLILESSVRRRGLEAVRVSTASASPASLITTTLLAVILLTGPAVLGGDRLWIQLPLLGGVALVLLIQALRLGTVLRAGAFRQIDAIDLSVFLFVIYALARWLTSPTEYFSRLEILDVVAYAVIFLTCRYGLAKRSYGLALLVALVVLGLGETAFGYYLSLHSDASNPQTLWFPFGPTEQLQLHYAPRWLGTYGCPNNYASLLVMATGAALALGAFSKFPWPVRIVFFYAAAIIMVGIVHSESRGSCLSLVAAVGALTFFGLRNGTLRWWIPVAGAVLLIVGFAGALASSPQVRERVDEAETTLRTGKLPTYIRVQLAEDALRIAHDHPIFGTGPATFIFVHPRYQSSTFAFKAVLTHDDYLNCLDDYGLVGFGLAMLFVALVTLSFFRPLRTDVRWQERSLIAAGFAAWCALLVHSLLDFNLHIPGNAMMLFALTGLGLRRAPRQEAMRHWSTISLAPLGRWLGGGLLVLGLLYGFEVARTGWSNFIYDQTLADVRNVPSIQSVQGIEEALAYDPGNERALLLLGDLYRVRGSMQKNLEDIIPEDEKALEAYGRAWKGNPLDDTIQARRGLVFDAMHRYMEAFFCFRAAVTAQPYNGEFWNAFGSHFWQADMLLQAEEAYQIGIHCPYDGAESLEPADKVRILLGARGVPLPPPGTSPLGPQPDTDEIITTP